MVSAFLLIGFVFALVLSLVIFIIYKILYDKHMNRVLQSGGDVKKGKWLAPWALLLIVLGVQLVGVIGCGSLFAAFAYVKTDGQNVVEELGAAEDLSFYVTDETSDYVPQGFKLVKEDEENGIEYKIYQEMADNGLVHYILVANYTVPSEGLSTITTVFEPSKDSVSASNLVYHNHEFANKKICFIGDYWNTTHNADIVLTIVSGEKVSEAKIHV